MRVQLRLGYVWGEQCRYLGPSEYLITLAASVRSLQAKGIEMDVHIKTHPRFMDKWVDFLVRTLFCVIFLYSVFGFTLVRKMSNKKLLFQYHLVYHFFWSSVPVVGETLRRFIVFGSCTPLVLQLRLPISSVSVSFFSLMYISLTDLPYRATTSRTDGRSRQCSSCIQCSRTDSLSKLSTDSAKDIACQG